MRHAAPGATAEREVVLADAVPQVVEHLRVLRVARGLVDLGQADQVPGQLIGLAGGDLGGVNTGLAAAQQCEFRVRLGLLKNPLSQRQVARLAGRDEQLDGRVEQDGGRHAVVVAQAGDVDLAFDQAAPAQIADAPSRRQITRLGQRGVRGEQAQQKIGMRPDVPGA